MVLQFTTAWIITNGDNVLLLQFAIVAVSSQAFITISDIHDVVKIHGSRTHVVSNPKKMPEEEIFALPG